VPDAYDPRFPFGKPKNREDKPALTPIAGRPGWFVDCHGKHVYIEPPRPKQPNEWFPSVWAHRLNQ
jgi:hypothetical protein